MGVKASGNTRKKAATRAARKAPPGTKSTKRKRTKYQPKATDKLTPQQAQFCEEYLVDLNGVQAAIRAGYSPRSARTTGSRLLSYANVKARIAELSAARSERTKIDQDQVIRELARIAFSDIRKLCNWGERHVLFVPSEELDDDAAATVSEVWSETNTFTSDNGDSQTTVKLKLKTYDKLGALRDLLKHLSPTGGDNSVEEFAAALRDAVRGMDAATHGGS